MGCTSSNIPPDLGGALPLEKKEPTIMRGDLTLKYEARHIREQKMKEKQTKSINAAEEMSMKIMEEKEMLSLGTIRSRTNSCVTSRTGSPTNNNRKQVHFQSGDTDNSKRNGNGIPSKKSVSGKDNNVKVNSQSTDEPAKRTKSSQGNETVQTQQSHSNELKNDAAETKGQKVNQENENSATKDGDVGPVLERLSTIEERANSRASGKLDADSIKRG